MIALENQLTATHLADTLGGNGYTGVAIVSSGENALSMAKNFSLDLVLMDIMLNGLLNGVTTGAKILTAIQCPIIYLTPYPEKPSKATAEYPPTLYLPKKVNEQQLLETVALALSLRNVSGNPMKRGLP